MNGCAGRGGVGLGTKPGSAEERALISAAHTSTAPQALGVGERWGESLRDDRREESRETEILGAVLSRTTKVLVAAEPKVEEKGKRKVHMAEHGIIIIIITIIINYCFTIILLLFYTYSLSFFAALILLAFVSAKTTALSPPLLHQELI